MKKITYVLIFAFLFIGCEKERRHAKPYKEFFQVGFLGHGAGFIGEIGINYWGLSRRCDSCHAVRESIHPDLGTCNSCHQPHETGWEKSTMALYHDTSLPLVGRQYHFKLKCTECHNNLTTRDEYKQGQCIQCHHHSRRATEFAHELMDEFDLAKEFKDHRCISCHALTGKEYHLFYDPETGFLL